MGEKYTVGDFLAELFFSKLDSDLKFEIEDENGNRMDVEFVKNEQHGRKRVFVFKETETSKIWRELAYGNDGK